MGNLNLRKTKCSPTSQRITNRPSSSTLTKTTKCTSSVPSHSTNHPTPLTSSLFPTTPTRRCSRSERTDLTLLENSESLSTSRVSDPSLQLPRSPSNLLTPSPLTALTTKRCSSTSATTLPTSNKLPGLRDSTPWTPCPSTLS